VPRFFDDAHVTRRHVVQRIGAAIACSVVTEGVTASDRTAGPSVRSEPPGGVSRNQNVEYGQDTLPPGVRSRRVDNNNDVTMHILEAGF
jgi:hypothetical protein